MIKSDSTSGSTLRAASGATVTRDVESEDCKYYAYRYYEGEHNED